MRVTTSYNPYAYRQQAGRANAPRFAEMFASRAADKKQAFSSSNIHPWNAATFHRGGCRCGQLIIPEGWRNTSAEPDKYDEIIFGELIQAEPADEIPVPNPTYPKSIYNLSAEELELARLGAFNALGGIDITGLSKGEIYNRYEAVYKDYLGEDFQEPFRLYCGMMNGSSDEYTSNLYMIARDFEQQLSSVGAIGPDAPIETTLKEARGYTGMSDEEIRDAVRARYSENMTLRECITMAWELKDLGLENKNYGIAIRERIFATAGYIDPNSTEGKTLFGLMLDLPADFDAMKAAYDAYEKGGRATHPTGNMDSMFTKLLSWFGGSESSAQGLRAMLNNMMDEGKLFFDEYGFCLFDNGE